MREIFLQRSHTKHRWRCSKLSGCCISQLFLVLKYLLQEEGEKESGNSNGWWFRCKIQKSPETKIHLMQIPHVGKVGNLPGTRTKMSCAATSSSSSSSSSSWIPTAYPSVRILLRKEASSRTLLLDPSFLPYAPPPLVFVSIFSLPGQLTSSVHSLFAANNEPVHNQLRATDAELGERERERSAPEQRTEE